jgi:hypothetical protein
VSLLDGLGRELGVRGKEEIEGRAVRDLREERSGGAELRVHLDARVPRLEVPRDLLEGGLQVGRGGDRDRLLLARPREPRSQECRQHRKGQSGPRQVTSREAVSCTIRKQGATMTDGNRPDSQEPSAPVGPRPRRRRARPSGPAIRRSWDPTEPGTPGQRG